MQEEIKRQVVLQLSSQRQSTSYHGVNIGPLQLRSNCACTKLPNQDDALQHFPVDDIIEKMTQCELYIPMGNSTVMVVHSIVSLVDPDKTPRSHGNPIPPGYYSILVDRVIKDYREVALDFPRSDGKKTLGQAEHSFIVWCKRYIISPEALASSPPLQLPHHMCR
jgi:hypothetical protein